MCDAFLETEILRFETNSSPRLPVLPFYFFTFLPFYLFTFLPFYLFTFLPFYLSLATVSSSLAALRQKCLKSSGVRSFGRLKVG